MKKTEERENINISDVREEIFELRFGSKLYKKTLFSVLALAILLLVFMINFMQKEINSISLSKDDAISLVASPIAATVSTKGVITIPSGVVKANPFLPYKNLGELDSVNDVPAFNLIEPPEVVNANSDAARVMDTIVSGILYDKYSPSAILNIEGNDYLVKKGDVVNNYKVLEIEQDSVSVRLGNNTYKAGIGEILTEGTLNHNNVSNLNKKFGGVQ